MKTEIALIAATILVFSILASRVLADEPVVYDLGVSILTLDFETKIVVNKPDVPVAPEGRAETVEFYYASWCLPCQTARPVMLSLKLAGYNVKMINVDEDDTPREWKQVPTYFYVRDGEVVKTVAKRQTRKQMMEILWKEPNPLFNRDL